MSLTVYKKMPPTLFDTLENQGGWHEETQPILFRVGSRELRTSPVFASYWRLAYERQEMFFRRLLRQPAPWTP
jgi:hypothetical protein